MGATADGTIDTWSRGATELYGWEPAEVLGRPLAVLLPPDRVHEPLLRQTATAGGEVPPFETVRLHRDGTPVPVEVHVVPVRDETGEVVGVVALHRDLRGLRAAVTALEATQEHLQARFADSPLAQSLVDMDGRVLAVNRAMEQLQGRGASELVGQDALTSYIEEDQVEMRRTLRELASGRISYVRHDRTLVRPDGQRLEVVMTVTLVHGEDGRPLLAGALEDVTALRAAERELATLGTRFEVLLQTMPLVVFTYDRDGICTSSRGQGLRHWDREQDELVGSDLLETYGSYVEVKDALAVSLTGHPSSSRLEADGRVWACEYRPLLGSDGQVQGGMGIALDVTAQAAAEREVAASGARLTSLLQHAHDVVLVLDLSGRIVYASAAARAHFGYDEAELFWRDALAFNHPDDRPLVASAWRSVLHERGATTRFECRVLHADGSWRWADHVLTNLVAEPAVGGIVVNVTESTERHRQEEVLRRLAVRDGLTGLANRTLLLDRLDHALATGRRTGAATGLVLLDVQGMTALNERLGQGGGDQVLRAVAERLAGALRPKDSVARVAGDAFAVLAEDVASEEDLRARASALREVAEEPIAVDDEVVLVTLEGGTALSPAADGGALLASAERSALESRRATHLAAARPAFEPVGAADTGPDELSRAVREGQLVLHYQPIVRLADERVVGFEALVRWQHPERGLLLPADFIRRSEATGVIADLGAWVLREAVAQLARWRERPLTVALNLSPRQLVDQTFPALLRELLADAGVEPARLVLEVTESALMDDPVAPDVLQALRETGVHLALDDFGTGYSSLTYLKRFPVDAIKIDRSFVAGLGRDVDDDAIVASIASLGRAVGKLVVAEGVETAAQLDALRALGVDQGQGFLWSRPLHADSLESWLAKTRPVQPARRPAVAPAPSRRVAAPVDGADEARILELHRQGASLHTIAAALNAEGRRTPAGPRWTTTTVARVVAALVPPV